MTGVDYTASAGWAYYQPIRPDPAHIAENTPKNLISDRLAACALLLANPSITAHDRAYYESVRDALRAKL